MVRRRPPPLPLDLTRYPPPPAQLPQQRPASPPRKSGYGSTASTSSSSTTGRTKRKKAAWSLLRRRERGGKPAAGAAAPAGTGVGAATRANPKKRKEKPPRRPSSPYSPGMASSSAPSSGMLTPGSTAPNTRPGTPGGRPPPAPSGTLMGALDHVTDSLFGLRRRRKSVVTTPGSTGPNTPVYTPAGTRPTTPVTLKSPKTTTPIPTTPTSGSTTRKRPPKRPTGTAAVDPPPRPASAPPTAGAPPPPPPPPPSSATPPKKPRQVKSTSKLRPKTQHPLVSRSAPLLRSGADSVPPHRPYPVRSLFDPSQERVPKSWHMGPSRALVIGLSYKRNPGAARPLNGTTNDARKVCQMLLDMGYPEDEIGLMLDDDARFSTPSTKDVMQAIKWLIDGATSNHRLFFYFAGHGSQIRDEDGDELDGRDEVLRMADGGYIVDDWLNAEMLQPLPEGCHFTALLDCCHSGTALDLPHNYDAFGAEVLEKGLGDAGKPSTKDQAIFTRNSVMKRTRAHAVLFSACADLEVAWDAKFEDDFGVTNKGLFTEYFVRNVYNKLLDVNHAVSYKDLLYDTSWDVVGWCHANRHRLPNKRKYQTPQLSSGKPLDMTSPVCM